MHKQLTTINYIKSLIAQGEHQQLDFKFEVNDSKKIARTLSAFSNTNGGRLLIGVKDNGNITGVKTDEEYYMIESAAQLHCKPEVKFTCKPWLVDGKTVLEILIPGIKKKSVFAKDEKNNWCAYVRVNDKNIIASKILLRSWKMKRKHKGTFFRFSDNELLLVDYLKKNTLMNIETYARLAHVTMSEAENILLNMLAIGVIEIRIAEKGEAFVLINDKK